MSYKKLEIWQLARELSVEIHRMTIKVLPKFEMYEEGSQIRRSIKSVRSNIVEGYGRRRYKQEFIRFLTCAHASCDETVDHLETLFETESLKDKTMYQRLLDRLHTLGRKLYTFIQGVESSHQSVKEPEVGYGDDNRKD
ncbi:MAG: four helix bundle protein [Candidatus Bathyarchaeia archaeon]